MRSNVLINSIKMLNLISVKGQIDEQDTISLVLTLLQCIPKIDIMKKDEL